jgi:hypothetical protein
MRSILVGLGLAGLVVAVATPSQAQDLAMAEAQFNRGLAEMEEGRYESGCPALEESQRLDPRPGTLFTLAECEALRGRVATAMTRFQDYMTLFERMTPDQRSKQQGREVIVKKRQAELAAKVPTLTLRAPASPPRGMVVKRGDLVLSSASLGVALPVDPGEYVVVTEAAGLARNEQSVTIQVGEKKAVDLVFGAPLPADDEGLGPAPGSSGRPDDAPSGRRIAAYAVGGVGVAGLALGTITGVLTLGEKSTIDETCTGTVCSQEGLDAADSASTLGLLSTIGFGVGIAGVATAIVLVVTEPSPATAAALPRIGAGPEGASVTWSRAFF